MAKVAELSHAQHGDLKLDRSAAMQVAATQHLVSLRVSEVVRAVCSLPIFFTRDGETGELVLTALTSFHPGASLFVADGEWQAIYTPAVLQTHPLYLMPAKDGEGFAVGIDEESPALSTKTGEALYDESGEASIYLKQLTQLLEADLAQAYQTQAFCASLERQQLIKPVALNVVSEDGEPRLLRGLSTIDEVALQALSEEQFQALNASGYLPPIYAMLMSIYQLNLLVQMNNRSDGLSKVKQVKLEMEKQPR